jgi:hypothetical protein
MGRSEFDQPIEELHAELAKLEARAKVTPSGDHLDELVKHHRQYYAELEDMTARVKKYLASIEGGSGGAT